jgi:hypothetical protein
VETKKNRELRMAQLSQMSEVKANGATTPEVQPESI